jgi:DNA gyrase subunit A
MLITDGGKVLRCPVSGISSMGRATQGVRVMNLDSGEKLVSIARLAEEDVEAEVEADASSSSETPETTETAETTADESGNGED